MLGIRRPRCFFEEPKGRQPQKRHVLRPSAALPSGPDWADGANRVRVGTQMDLRLRLLGLILAASLWPWLSPLPPPNLKKPLKPLNTRVGTF